MKPEDLPAVPVVVRTNLNDFVIMAAIFCNLKVWKKRRGSKGNAIIVNHSIDD